MHAVEKQKFEMDKPLQSFKSHSQASILERDNIAVWDLEKTRLRTCCERGILALTYGVQGIGIRRKTVSFLRDLEVICQPMLRALNTV